MQSFIESAKKNPPRVLLVPYGPVEHEDIEFLVRALSERGMKISIATEREVPVAAFNPARQQYRGAMPREERDLIEFWL